ncbi:MAG: hypothetical protein EOO39_25645, partial [Cytophagaceae bacterium]
AVVSFQPGPASISASTCVVDPNNTTANNSNSLIAVLTLRDANNNPIVGAYPSFGSSGNNTTVISSGNTSNIGQASATYKTPLAQNENATVSVGGINLYAPMSFVAGAPSSASSTFVVNPNVTPGDGTPKGTLTLMVRDVQGNPVRGANVTLGATGGNTTFTVAAGITLSDGSFSTTVASTQMQTENITANLASYFMKTATVTFTGPPSAANSTLVVNPNNQTVGPSNVVNATVTLVDSAGNPLANVVPIWSASGTNNTIISNGATSSSGIGTAAISTPVAQNENILVGSGGVSLHKPVTYVAGSPNATTSYMYAIPARQLANNTNSITVSLMLLDSFNNSISGKTASFSASGTNTSVNATAATDSTGMAQAVYKSSVIQNENAVCSVSGFTLTTPLIFTGIPARCTLTVNPNSRPADGNSAIKLTASVIDSNNQPIPNIQVFFSSSGAAQMFTAENVVTPSNGTVSTGLTSLYAGSNSFLAQAANVQCASQGVFNTRTAYCMGSPNYVNSTIASSGNPVAVEIADLNGDGLPDIVASIIYDGNLEIYLATSGGHYQAQPVIALGGRPLGITSGDFDGNGTVDLALSNYRSQNVEV